MFDDILSIEAELVNKGKEDGERDSREKLRVETQRMARTQGNMLGFEIGFYRGFCNMFGSNETKQLPPSIGSVKLSNLTLRKTLAAFISGVREFPTDEPLTESNHELLLQLRAKYKLICSRMGISPQWPEHANKTLENGAPASNDEAKHSVPIAASLNVEDMF